MSRGKFPRTVTRGAQADKARDAMTRLESAARLIKPGLRILDRFPLLFGRSIVRGRFGPEICIGAFVIYKDIVCIMRAFARTSWPENAGNVIMSVNQGSRG